jgi:hypothetical protein
MATTAPASSLWGSRLEGNHGSYWSRIGQQVQELSARRIVGIDIGTLNDAAFIHVETQRAGVPGSFTVEGPEEQPHTILIDLTMRYAQATHRRDRRFEPLADPSPDSLTQGIVERRLRPLRSARRQHDYAGHPPQHRCIIAREGRRMKMGSFPVGGTFHRFIEIHAAPRQVQILLACLLRLLLEAVQDIDSFRSRRQIHAAESSRPFPDANLAHP